jgi:hypothetical protein
MSNAELTLLTHILETNLITGYMHDKVRDYMEKTEIAKWLSSTQAKLISEILSSENFIERLTGYKELQENRNSDWIKKKYNAKPAIDIFSDLILGLYDKRVADTIRGVFNGGDVKLIFERERYEDFICKSLVRNFNYYFTLIYKEQGGGQNV